MKLIVGLGNPGPRYETTRHNAGFLIIDQIADKYDIAMKNQKGLGEFGKGRVQSEECLLFKPSSFMNLSGKPVSYILNYFKIPHDCLTVIHDDIDVPVGKVKSRFGGGAGGHKGISSIINETGNADFHRIKLGVGKPEDESIDVRDWVLQPFTDDNLDELAGPMFEGVLLRIKGIFEQKAHDDS